MSFHNALQHIDHNIESLPTSAFAPTNVCKRKRSTRNPMTGPLFNTVKCSKPKRCFSAALLVEFGTNGFTHPAQPTVITKLSIRPLMASNQRALSRFRVHIAGWCQTTIAFLSGPAATAALEMIIHMILHLILFWIGAIRFCCLSVPDQHCTKRFDVQGPNHAGPRCKMVRFHSS